MKHQLRVAAIWNGTVLYERTYSQTSKPKVSFGESITNDVIVPTPTIPEFEIFQRTEDGYLFRAPEGLDFTVNEVESERRRIELTAGDWGVVHVDHNFMILFQVFDDELRVAGRGLEGRVETPLIGTLGVSMSLHVAFLILANLFFQVDPILKEAAVNDRWVDFLAVDVQEPPPENEAAVAEQATGAKAPKPEGTIGTKESDLEESNIPKEEGELAERFDPTNVGVAHAINSLGSGPLKQIFESNTGFDNAMKVAMDGNGTDFDPGRGTGGMSLRGDGVGGNGSGPKGRIQALGEVDTGGGKDHGVKIAKKEEKVIATLEVHTPISGEFCESNLIRQVVNAKANAIKYCFEKELQMKPDLHGKVISQWTIDTEGKVKAASIASSTMDDSAVEGCITRVIKKMRFSAPKGGGMCVIKYPFVFSGL